jgi:deoxyribose-phosphate aldolase
MDSPDWESILDIAKMIDISAVRADSADQQIADLISVAHKYNCYLATVLPSQTFLAKTHIPESSSLKLGGNVGFPSGGQTSSIKIKETLELVDLGVAEIDMVMNIAAHISGRYTDVYNEILAIVNAAQNRPVKVILECSYLTDDQIKIGCDLAVKAGAAFIKTGTGWTSTGATLENISLIHTHVGDAIQIKASGGIRKIETMIDMYRCGARRFGISLKTVSSLFKDLENRNGDIS